MLVHFYCEFFQSPQNNRDCAIVLYSILRLVKVYTIPRVYQSVCPFVRIGSPHPLYHKRVCPPPQEPKVGGSQFGRLERKPGTLCLYTLCCNYSPWPIFVDKAWCTYIVSRWVTARWIVDNIGRSALNLSVEFLGPEQECKENDCMFIFARIFAKSFKHCHYQENHPNNVIFAIKHLTFPNFAKII